MKMGHTLGGTDPHAQNLLAPTSIAVIGASAEPQKIGYQVLANIIKGGYTGKIYPVNPHADRILRHQCFKSVLDISENVDLAMIVIPSQVVRPVVEECAKKKIHTVVIISAGFKETGKDGAKLQQEVEKIARDSEINIIGPNCLGFMNTELRLNATFSATTANPGNVVFFSQSGAFGTAVLDWATKVSLGFKYFVSIGNKATVNENVLLEQWLTEFENSSENIVFAGYLEDFSDGHEFMKVASRISKTHPIVIFKPGKAPKAQEAISSHTGSIATEDKIVDAALKQSGCIRVQTMEEMFNTIQLLSRQSIPRGNRVAIVTNAGGPGVATVDCIAESRLEMAELSETTKYSLSQKLPPAANIKNPVDVLGDAPADRYDAALEILSADENVDAMIVLLTPQAITQCEKTASIICEKYRKYSNKPIVPCFLGGSIVSGAIEILNQYQMPIYQYPDEAVTALENAYMYRTRHGVDALEFPNLEIASPVGHSINVVGKRAEELVEDYGITIPPCIYLNPGEKVTDLDFDFPVVAKLISPQLVHKTELSAVKLNLTTSDELNHAITQLSQTWTQAFPDSDYFQIQVQQQIKGENMIVGFKRDASFGPVILFGAGGILTELFKDTSQRIAPVDREMALEMIQETKVAKILEGFRGSEPQDIEAIANTIVRVSQIALEHPEIKEFDINPFIVLNQSLGGTAVDVKIIT